MTMAEVLYPDGYSGLTKTIDQVFARSSVKMLHPEYQKRWKGLMIASQGKLGVGGGGRSTEQQKRVFLERHQKVASGGCCSYQGLRYQIRTGMAHAAPPGRSFHEDIVYGGAAAVDAVGDLKWAAVNCEKYGLEQATWGGEVWHFQFTEFPHSVSQWLKLGSPQPQNWKIPSTTPVPPPTPPTTPPTTDWVAEGAKMATPPGTPNLNRYLVHPNVTWLQAVLCSMPKPASEGGAPIYNPAWVDKDKTTAQFGDATWNSLKYWQGKNGLTADGSYGPQTASKMAAVRGK
jgi:peptidoglycan hydrolase-like protein with peptidoglycan-binding domain